MKVSHEKCMIFLARIGGKRKPFPTEQQERELAELYDTSRLNPQSVRTARSARCRSSRRC
jgi:hypothetical protein